MQMDGSNRAVVDHYRCPEDVAGFESAGSLRHDPEYFRFGAGPLFDALDHATINGSGAVGLPFDPNAIIEHLRYERYRPDGERAGSALRGGSMVRTLYYAWRPFLPVSIRRHLQRAYLSNWRAIQ